MSIGCQGRMRAWEGVRERVCESGVYVVVCKREEGVRGECINNLRDRR